MYCALPQYVDASIERGFTYAFVNRTNTIELPLMYAGPVGLFLPSACLYIDIYEYIYIHK